MLLIVPQQCDEEWRLQITLGPIRHVLPGFALRREGILERRLSLDAVDDVGTHDKLRLLGRM